MKSTIKEIKKKKKGASEVGNQKCGILEVKEKKVRTRYQMPLIKSSQITLLGGGGGGWREVEK